MAERLAFPPSLVVGGVRPSSLGGSAVSPGSSFTAPHRAAPAARVVGDGTFRHIRPAGVGFYRRPLVEIDFPVQSFISQARSEVPEALATRQVEITLPRGSTVNVFA